MGDGHGSNPKPRYDRDVTEMWRDLLALFALVVAPSIGLGARLLELFATLAGVRGGVRWGEVG